MSYKEIIGEALIDKQTRQSLPVNFTVYKGRRIPIIRGGMPIGDNVPARIADWVGVGTTYYVDAAIGSDSNTETQAQSEATPWATIMKAVNTMIIPATGHVRIRVKPGTYRAAGNANAVQATVNFFSLGARTPSATHVVIIEAYDPDDPPIIEEPSYTGGTPNTSERHGFWFDDSSAHHIRIRGLIVRPNGSAVPLNQCQGFRIDATTTDIEIEKCTIYGWNTSGGGTQPRSQGIFISNAAQRVQVYDTIIHDIGNNTTEAANLSHGLYIGGSDHTFVNVLVYDCRNGFGFQFYEGGGGGTGHIVSHIVTSHNKKSGVVVDGTFTVNIYNSIFHDNDEWGVSARATATVVVHNSISYDNGLAGDEGDGYNTEGTSTITRNNCIVSDPLFVNYPDRDYHINTSSPAYDNGLIEYSTLLDLEGSSRVTSTIGVFIAPEEIPSPPPDIGGGSVLVGLSKRQAKTWRIIHKNHAFQELGECFPSNLNFSLPLSAVGDVSYELAIDDPLATWQKTYPKRTDYLLMYGNHELQGGIHTGVNINDVERETLQISGNDYLHYLEGRWYPFDPENLAAGGFIWPINSDLFVIVEDMLDATLALSHSLPLTYNNRLSGQTINDFKIELGDTEAIKSKIETLSKKLPGFDYEITPQRELKMYSGGKGTIRNFTFEQGRNIFLLDYSNRGPEGTHTLGVAQGEGNKIARSRDHSGMPTYRRWDVHEEISLATTDTQAIQDATDAESERNIAPKLEFSAKYVDDADVDIFAEVSTGDRCMVHADLDWDEVHDYMRIVNIQGVTDDEGNFELQFTFDNGTLAQ